MYLICFDTTHNSRRPKQIASSEMKVYIASTCFWPFIFTTLVSSLGCTNSGVRTNRIMSKAHTMGNGRKRSRVGFFFFWVSTTLNMQIFDAYIGHVFRFSDIIYDYQLVDLICVTLCRSIALMTSLSPSLSLCLCPR